MPASVLKRVLRFAALGAGLALAGCGGGGGGGSGQANNPAPPPPSSGSGWLAGSFLPAASFAGKCVSPRTGTDPFTGQPYNEVQGTVADENNWLRSWSNDQYLWYSEIVDRDPGVYTTPDYFGLLKTMAVMSSGRAKDRFHFAYPSAQWAQLAQSGVEAGYGIAWAVVASTPPRRVVVAYIEPGSPAQSVQPSIGRGEEVQTVDGVDLVFAGTQADVDRFVAGLYPANVGESHTFTLRNPSTGTVRSVTLQSAAVTKVPVMYNVMAPNGGPVGWLLFQDHLAPAEQKLVEAIDAMQAAQVRDLIIDLRYNGGGLLAIASELAYMIAGPAATAGQTFEQMEFNDKHPSINPVTGNPITPMPFYSTTLGFSTTAGQPLPTLNLPRVFVLTGGTTCSASESIINSLRGVGIQVIQIGATTCGKPYGFYPAEHCGTTYFSVQMKGVNAQGFGDYTDGFAPANSPSAGGTRVEGCAVADDFNYELGDTREARLAAALQYWSNGTCPAVSASDANVRPQSFAPKELTDGIVSKPPWLENRVLDRL